MSSDNAASVRLREILSGYGKLSVAFSGGVDSVFLLKAAVDALGSGNVLAVTADSLIFPQYEIDNARDLVAELGVRHLRFTFDAFAVENFAENPPDRCYYCKKALFSRIIALSMDNGYTTAADGSNVDDDGDYRPGMRAAQELGVASPLKQAGMTKTTIRRLSRDLGLFSWNKPSMACLASRFPYGSRITEADVLAVDKAERFLFRHGFQNVRVRRHGDVARIEVNPEERSRFFDAGFMDEVANELQSIGFQYAALDLRGFRTGSMNETLKGEAH